MDSDRQLCDAVAATDQDTITAAVSQMQANGGDDSVQSVLQLADQGLRGVDPKAKHVILITDGETPDGAHPGVVQQMNADDITRSTIGIGHQINVGLLQRVAQLGKGGYYDASDPFNLPQLVIKQTQQPQRQAIVVQHVALGPRPQYARLLRGMGRGPAATTRSCRRR